MKDEKTIIVHLDAVEQGIQRFQKKYGVNYEQFTAKLERGELGDPYAYELEQDAMRWEDLADEKKMWLEQLHKVGEIP